MSNGNGWEKKPEPTKTETIFFFFSQDLITKAWNRIRAMHKQDATQCKLNLAVNVKW